MFKITKDGATLAMTEDTFNLARMDADDDRHRNYADEEDFKESGFEFEDAPEDAGADIGLDDLDSDSDDE